MVTTMPAVDMLQIRRQEAIERLARQCPQFVAEHDDVGGGWLVRNERVLGRTELVINGQCSCLRGKVFAICKHIAAVER